ncbi:MAG: hypothetical protein WBD31_30930 [Rubripirellula sp.]
MAFQQTFAFAAPAKPSDRYSLKARKTWAPDPPKPEKQATPDVSTKLDAPALPNTTAQSDAPVKSGEPPLPTRDQILRDLRSRAGCISTVEAAGPVVETFSTGNDAVDQLLPRKGLKVDSVTEWVGENYSNATCALSLVTAAQRLTRHAGPLVVVARPADFYPPAAVALGIPADRIIWVRPNRHADAVWSIDQSLRCESVAAVWSLVGAELDDRDARRFQLASEIGRTPGLLVRPIATRGKPTFAETRFHVAMEKNVRFESRHQTSFPALRVMLDRCRGTAGGIATTVMIDDHGRMISLNAKSASSKAAQPNPVQSNPIQPNPVQPNPVHPHRHHETAAMRLASELAHPKTAANRSTQQSNQRSSQRRA